MGVRENEGLIQIVVVWQRLTLMCGGKRCWRIDDNGEFFFFNQKTAYEMRISDWSSDVWLFRSSRYCRGYWRRRRSARRSEPKHASRSDRATVQIGRASCRERVCQYV